MKCSWSLLTTHSFRLAILLGGALFLIAPMQAQEDGYVKAVKLDGKEESRFRKMYDGKEPVKGNTAQEEKENLAILDKAARWFAYRLTEPGYQEGTEKKTMSSLVKEAGQFIRPLEFTPTLGFTNPKRPMTAEQTEFINQFSKALTAHLRKVVKNDKPITRVNAARILALLTLADQEEAADVLVEVLKDPNESDGVKLWAARGLKDLFTSKQPAKDRELRCITALTDYLNKLSTAPTSKLAPEEEQGIRYVRREVIRALGQSRYPAVGPAGKEVSPAWVLLRVARHNGVEPEPNVMEQVEAAIGVCQLQPKLTKDYNVDYAAIQIGEFIVDFAGYAINPTNLPKANGDVAIAWKIQATRLMLALDKLSENAPTTTIKAMVARAKTVLADIQNNKAAPATTLEEWLKDKTAKGVPIIKSQPNTTLN